MFDLGPLTALCCAITWSTAVILFKKSGEHLHSVVVNLYKNGLAFFLMIPTLYLVEGIFIFPTTHLDFAILVISGIFGIGIADALFLAGLKRLGATRTALVDCLYSPSVIVLSYLLFQETLTMTQFFGGVLVIGAILLVSRKSEAEHEAESQKALLSGILIGASAMIFMAIGIVIVKPLFPKMPLFWILEVRVGAGFLASIISFLFLKNRKLHIAALVKSERKVIITAACLMATYFSMIFWVASFKYSTAAVASILNQTSTIFTVIMATVFLKEPLDTLKILATFCAITGVLLIVL